MLSKLLQNFLWKIVIDIIISAVLATVYALLIFRGTCLFTDSLQCSRSEFLKETVPLGTVYISTFMIVIYELPRLITRYYRAKKAK